MTDASPRFSLQAPYGMPLGDTEPCPYPELPQGMRTFSAPSLYDLQPGSRVRRLLRELAERVAGSVRGESAGSLDLLHEDEECRRFFGEILGRGEVVATAHCDGQQIRVEESVFAGVWRETRRREDVPVRDEIVCGPIPDSLPELAERLTAGHRCAPPADYPPDLMNAPSVLCELLSKSETFRPGREDIVNLTLFPLTAEDLAYLDRQLGSGGLELLTRGYGECRMRLTAVPNLWWVQYFNASAQMILNTLEVTRLPQVARAAPEDLEDTRRRLLEVLALLD
jgi:hydrogenase-1 operon protein HyaF